MGLILSHRRVVHAKVYVKCFVMKSHLWVFNSMSIKSSFISISYRTDLLILDCDPTWSSALSSASLLLHLPSKTPFLLLIFSISLKIFAFLLSSHTYRSNFCEFFHLVRLPLLLDNPDPLEDDTFDLLITNWFFPMLDDDFFGKVRFDFGLRLLSGCMVLRLAPPNPKVIVLVDVGWFKLVEIDEWTSFAFVVTILK